MIIDVNSDPAHRRRSDTLCPARLNMQRCRKSNIQHAARLLKLSVTLTGR